MSFWSGAAHLAGNVAGPLAELAGGIQDFGPGHGTGQLTQLGHNITSPNVHLSNPGGLLASHNPAFTGAGAYNPAYQAPQTGGGGSQGGGGQDTGGGQYAGGYGSYGNGYGSGGGGGGSANATTIAQNNAYLDSQAANLNSLLGRTDTGLNQGLSKLNDSYTGNVNQQTNQENQALQDYADNRVQTNKDKLGAYDTINRNANSGYRSLAQIIGHASGSGSSAFQQLLPDVVGKDISGKRGVANQTYASNLGNIDTAQKKTELSFSNILADLANQRQAQEQQLRTGVEQQRQSLQGQLDQNATQRVQNNGGGYAQVAAAQAPYQTAIDNSRNAVESFFAQFKPTVTPQQAAIAAPDLTQYTVDRSNVNAQNQGAQDPTNPYAAILRRKLTEQGVPA